MCRQESRSKRDADLPARGRERAGGSWGASLESENNKEK